MTVFKTLPLAAFALTSVAALAQATPGQVPGQLPTQAAGPPAPDKTFVPNVRLEIADVGTIRSTQPGMRTAVAVVNGEVLTNTDVDQRLNLQLVAIGERKLKPEELGQLRKQILSNLVDESLQVQAAKADDLKVEDAAVEGRYASFAQQFGRTPSQMDAYLTSVQSSGATLRRQIRAELAWQKVLGRRVAYFVNVSDEEVNGVLDKLRASKGQAEYRVGEIYLSTPAGAEAQVTDTANKIMEQLRGGGNFAVYARQFSEASTAAVGGDLGWIRPEQLPPELATVAVDLEPGQVTGPIAVPGGQSILLLIDKRQVLTADPRRARLSLRQIAVALPPGTTEAEAATAVDRFGKEVATITSCAGADVVATRLGAEIVDNGDVTVGDLPPQLGNALSTMPIGRATEPFGSVKDGVRSLVLCAREAPDDATLPSPDAMKTQLENQRIRQSGRRYLRDLRRDAVIEYR